VAWERPRKTAGMQYSMDISATTIALQRSGLVEPIHKETRQFAKPIWGKKKQENNEIVSSRTASSDPTPKNKIETLTASHHRIAMITSSTETRRRMLLPHQNHSKCGTENSTRLCSSYTEKKGWHKFCIQVQFYTVASNTYFAPACAKIRRKT
jgi:hypothetical protein